MKLAEIWAFRNRICMQISSSFHSWGTKPASTVLPGTAHTKAATSNIPIFYAKRVFLSQTHYFQTSPLLPYFWFLSEQASTSPASLSFLLTVMWRCFTHVFFQFYFLFTNHIHFIGAWFSLLPCNVWAYPASRQNELVPPALSAHPPRPVHQVTGAMTHITQHSLDDLL